MTNTDRYYRKQYARGRWHVIGPNGPVYDDEPHGEDRPLIFCDEGEAMEYAERCNQQEEE